MSEDSQLCKAVIGQLDLNASVDTAHFSVTTLASVMGLANLVQSFTQRCSADTAARRIKSVRALVEALAIDLPFDGRRDDGDIETDVLNRLESEASLSADVEAKKHWTTRTGEAACQFERDAALHDFSHLPAFVGVANQFPIRPAQVAPSISDDTMHAVHRSWFFDPKAASVSVNSGVLPLAGKVHSWHNREVTARTAWAAAGSVAVKNDITVI